MSREWLSPKPEEELSWGHISSEIYLREKLSYEPLTCPSCKTINIRYFYVRFYVDENRGGFWICCSFCHRYEHASSKVPSWWIDIKNVPLGALEPYPDYLEENFPLISAQIEILLQNSV